MRFSSRAWRTVAARRLYFSNPVIAFQMAVCLGSGMSGMGVGVGGLRPDSGEGAEIDTRGRVCSP